MRSMFWCVRIIAANGCVKTRVNKKSALSIFVSIRQSHRSLFTLPQKRAFLANLVYYMLRCFSAGAVYHLKTSISKRRFQSLPVT